jgi:hypothetical protein
MTARSELIEAIRNQPSDERPFVCDRFPDECDVIVIGENPATRLKAPWRRFWNDDVGFEFNTFLANYKNEREAGGKRGEVSLTRSRMLVLRQFGLRCLETNVYSNENQHGAGSTRLENALLPLLLRQRSKWREIIIQGRKARKYVERSALTFPIEPIFVEHFSRPFWGKGRIEKFARDILDGNSRRWGREH